jgi:histone H3/H4
MQSCQVMNAFADVKRARKGMKYTRGVEREIQAEQLKVSKELLAIPKASFMAILKDTLQTFETPENAPLKISRDAVHVLHSVAEVAAVEALSLWNKSAIHGKRVTVQLCDIQHVRAMCHELSPGLLTLLRADAAKALKHCRAADGARGEHVD